MLEAACAIQSQAESRLMDTEYATESVAVLQLAATSGLSVNDCEFSLTVSLITTDKKLLRAFPTVALSLAAAAAEPQWRAAPTFLR